MTVISMDLLDPYSETETGNQYALTVICMLTNYVFMISNKAKTIEIVINAYLKHVYAIFASGNISLVIGVGKFPANNSPG